MRTAPLVVYPDRAAAKACLPAVHSFLSLTPGNLLLTACYRNDADGLTVRFYETEGRATTATLVLPDKARKAVAVDLQEQPVPLPVKVRGGQVTLAVQPWQIVTLKINQA